jgi:small GTP-binding protein
MKKKGNKKNKKQEDLDDNENIYTYKIILIGDSYVGKTSLILRFCKDKFDESSLSTIGIDTQIKYLMQNNKKIELQIWDTAGQEKFRSLAKSCCNQMQGVVFVFDLSIKETFKNIKTWYTNIEQIIDFKKVGAVLVGNKSDLEPHNINQDKIMEYANQKKMEYIVASAKKNINVNDIFSKLLDDIMQKSKGKKIENVNVHKLGRLSVAEEEEIIKKKKKCC